MPEAAGAGSAYHVYLIRCANGDFYTGITTDVARRRAEHAAGRRGAKFLRGKGPLELVYSAQVGDRSFAARVEYRVRRLARADKEALVAGRLTLAGLLPDLIGTGAQASGADCA